MNTRRQFLMHGGVAATAFLASKPFKTFAGCSFPFSFSDNNYSITLLHTSGLYNNADGSASAFDKTAAMIANLKKQNCNSLLFDTANNFCGQNAEAFGLQQPLSYDAVLPGKRGIDAEEKAGFFKQNLLNAKMPVIASNYDVDDNGLRKMVQAYRIINKGSVRIGIIGAASSGNDALTYKEPVEEISVLATKLKEQQHCHLIICLSNLGYKNKNGIDDSTLAFRCSNVDVIIGGGQDDGQLQRPCIILNKSGHEVVINHSGHAGSIIGQVKIGFDGQLKKNHINIDNISAV